MRSLSAIIEKFGIAVSVILLIAAFLMVYAIIETAMVVYKTAYRMIPAIVAPILNYPTRWRSKRDRRQSKRRIRTYLRSNMEDGIP